MKKPRNRAAEGDKATDDVPDTIIRLARWQMKNPQDATLRNIRALKARVSKLEQAVKRLQAQEVIVSGPPIKVNWHKER